MDMERCGYDCRRQPPEAGMARRPREFYGQPGERGGRADDAIGLVLSEFGARVPEKSIPALTTPLRVRRS